MVRRKEPVTESGRNELPDGRYFIGRCGVDSGQLMICDPCYLDDQIALNGYDGVMNARYGEPWRKADLNHAPRFAELKTNLGRSGVAVVFNSGWGDGEYPVYATIRNRRIVSVTVRME